MNCVLLSRFAPWERRASAARRSFNWRSEKYHRGMNPAASSPQPASTSVVLPTREGYDRWSEIYDGDGNPLMMLEEPHVDRLAAPGPGLRICDVGCGTGRHALRMAGQGARVTGVDFSEGMLARARAKAGAEKIEFVRHDLAQPLPF